MCLIPPGAGGAPPRAPPVWSRYREQDALARRPSRHNERVRLWHRHKWGEWERAWGKSAAKGYILERKCLLCGKTETQVIR